MLPNWYGREQGVVGGKITIRIFSDLMSWCDKQKKVIHYIILIFPFSTANISLLPLRRK